MEQDLKKRFRVDYNQVFLAEKKDDEPEERVASDDEPDQNQAILEFFLDDLVKKIVINQKKAKIKSNYAAFRTTKDKSSVSERLITAIEEAKASLNESNDKQQFYIDISTAIMQDEVIDLFKTHRGCKEDCRNIMFIIAGVLSLGFGLGFFYKGASQLSFFNPKTESKKKLDDLSDIVEKQLNGFEG